MIKTKLVTAPIIIAPDWELPSELMCDASDYACHTPNFYQGPRFLLILFTF